MGSAPHFNPPASSVAVLAAVYRPALWAGDPRIGENSDPERRREQVMCVPDRTEAQFLEGFDRRLALELRPEPGEPTGVTAEDVGTVREIAAAGSAEHALEWRCAMGKKFFGQGGDDSAKTVSGELIEEIQRGAAHGEERDGDEAEQLARRAPVPAAGQSERDWAWCLDALRRGLDPAVVRARLEERRAEDQPNPEDYARRTLESAAAALRRESPVPEIER